MNKDLKKQIIARTRLLNKHRKDESAENLFVIKWK